MEFIDPIFLIILGMTVGIYAGAIGAGGGFLIAPILLLRHPYATPTEITAAALIYVVINSAIQVSLAIREQKIDTKLILTLAIIGIPAAILGGLTTELIERVYFSFGFGIFLVLVGIYIMLRPTMISDRMPSQGWSRNIKDRQGNLYNYTVPVARSGIAQAATAFFSALAGIGGGPIGIPVMTRIQRVPHDIAVPSMHLLILIQSLSVTGVHFFNNVGGSPLNDVPWLAAGVLIAGPIALKVRHRTGEGNLMRALAIGLIIIGISAACDIFR